MRRARDKRLDSRSARASLAQRNAPYWLVISRGKALGYRKGITGGSWLARYRSAEGERYQTCLGPADDMLDAVEGAVLPFAEAQDRARQWFTELDLNHGARVVPITVNEALDDYLESFSGKSKEKTRWVADTYLRPELGRQIAAELTSEQIAKFHRALADRPARYRKRKDGSFKLRPSDSSCFRARKASANRVLAVFKAALNQAYRAGRVASDSSWRRVPPFPRVEASRVRYLSGDEAVRLVNAAPADFRPLIQAALLTGCRWSELTRAKVEDVDLTAGVLHVPVTKSGRPRHVHLTDEGGAFFRRQVTGRARAECIFINAHGRQFGASHQVRPMRESCVAAHIDPIGFHILRHTYGSRLAMAGVPLAVIAEALGHADERITRRHYAHLSPSYVRDVVRAGLGNMGVFEADNVVPLLASEPA